ncbi:5'-nucleotidase family protein [Skeletonema marinoi]|uniref:5'-nucleotidase family protein n=1 Tax=Skeletonema marinoi TaxID=267567 RepID=A0AAD9DE78_9STRA|nr:5'-nucleotidase family protein [Skeletonema marinoi]
MMKRRLPPISLLHPTRWQRFSLNQSSQSKIHLRSSTQSFHTTTASTHNNQVTVRLVSINDVYDLSNLPKLATFVRSLNPKASAVTLNGDFLSPSALSSIDNGRGHVAAIRAAGITHVSLGNHEADLQISDLKDRLNELGGRGSVTVLNSNIESLGRQSREMDIVSSECKSVSVALIGLMSDESDMFRDGTFRGLNIANVKETYAEISDKLNNNIPENNISCIVPLTHQSLQGDLNLAKWMLEFQSQSNSGTPIGGVILGGHEHVKIHEFVPDGGSNEQTIQVVKSGMNAQRAAIIDLQFENSTLQSVNVTFEELDDSHHQPCPIVKTIVEKRLAALDEMKDFTVIDANTMLAEYFVDSSETLFIVIRTHAVKQELDADACVINGAPMLAAKTYEDGFMSYQQLTSELPFPERRGRQVSKSTGGWKGEHRGYLHTDFEYWRQSLTCDSNELDNNEVISVALPRNLLKGFCKIQPLMDLYKELEATNALPNDDDYIKAVDIIVRFCCKDRWSTIGSQLSFEDLDLNRDGVLSSDEIREAINLILGEEEATVELVNSMIEVIDTNADGQIDEQEWNQILSRTRK